MAIQQSSEDWWISGKVGAVVGAHWKDKRILRSKPTAPIRRTARQLEWQEKYKNVVTGAHVVYNINGRLAMWDTPGSTKWGNVCAACAKIEKRNGLTLENIPLMPPGKEPLMLIDDARISWEENELIIRSEKVALLEDVRDFTVAFKIQGNLVEQDTLAYFETQNTLNTSYLMVMQFDSSVRVPDANIFLGATTDDDKKGLGPVILTPTAVQLTPERKLL